MSHLESLAGDVMGNGSRVVRLRVRGRVKRNARRRVDEAVVLRSAEQILGDRALLAARQRRGALEDAVDDATRASGLGGRGALRAESAHLRAQAPARVHCAELVVAHVRVDGSAAQTRVRQVVAVVVFARGQHREVARRRRMSGHEPVHVFFRVSRSAFGRTRGSRVDN